MELENIKRVYLIGIGGIGMSGLARYFKKRGCVVCGYDKTITPLTTVFLKMILKLLLFIPLQFQKIPKY
jgi:UDP-N-acetylmuramate--alanine ligase